ncbi:hypothetical protein [Vibrio parahaemolyticus]|uniref:hypothetical protein n=1 Tax=Vibrio parahaemolyticus TaxID=670 RepID=UPI001E51F091|nr:hypothetical protein [Vibrio parahaemolyticus]
MKHDVISEPELIDNLESKAVKTITLVQGEDNKFRIYATLTWKEGRQLLETQRKEPRTWASLDRLVKHINQRYENVPIIQLELRSNNNERGKHQKREHERSSEERS